MKEKCQNCGKVFLKVVIHPSVICCSDKCYKQLEEKETKKDK